jgi:hypothetical protein
MQFRMRDIKLANVWRWLRDYLGIARRGRSLPIVDTDSLRHFLETRASHVAQTSLYGYVRTRAGTRYPELFENDHFIASINIAKWQLWLACLSDLAVYAGGLLQHRTDERPQKVGKVIGASVEAALAAAGTPPDAGEAFGAGVDKLRKRLAATDWAEVTDDQEAFSESPDALVEWAPIVDELKQYDTEIVENSVRFRWQEVRRDLRRDLDARAVVDSVK